MTETEVAVKLEVHEHEIKSLKHRMGDQEEQSKTIQELVLSVKEALGGAEANCKYYASQYIGASAHYYVGFNGEVGSLLRKRTLHGIVG